MENKKVSVSVNWRLPRPLYDILSARKKARQPLAGVIEDILAEIKGIKANHDPIIDKISKLQNELDYFKNHEITTELLDRLSKRQHHGQTIGGVIQDLLATVEEKERTEIRLYTDKTIGRDM